MVCFYFPGLHPIAIPDGSTFTSGGDNVIPWLTDVEWDARLRWTQLIRDKDFVALVIHRLNHFEEFDNARYEFGARPSHATGGISLHRLRRFQIRFLCRQSDTKATVVEAITPLYDKPEGSQDSISFAFNRCIRELTNFEDAYMLVRRDLRYRGATRNDGLPFYSVC